MAGAVIGALRVVLGLDSAQFNSGMTAAQKRMKTVGAQMQAVGRSITNVGAAFTAGFTAPLLAAAAVAVSEAYEMKDAAGQVEAALTSMGDKAGRSMDQLRAQADKLAGSSLFEDDQILRGVTSNLLTFGNVSGAQFDRAQQAAVDLATRMKTDLQPATLMIGKALNAPTQGLAALRRVGIQFTEQQQAQIKAMDAAGNTAGAQAIMLSELERQFGGSGAAARAAATPMERISLAFKSMAGDLGEMLLPFVDRMAAKFEELTGKFKALSPEMQKMLLIGAGIAAAFGPVLIVVGTVVGALGSLATALAAGGVLAGLGAFALAAAPFVAAAAAIAAAIYVFRDDLAPIFAQFKAAVMGAVGPMLPELLNAGKLAFAAMGAAVQATIKVLGPILAGLAKAFLYAFGPIVVTAIRVLVAGLTNAFSIISATLRFFSKLLTGDWSGAWNAFGTLIGTIAQGIGRVIDAVFPGALQAITNMVDGVKKLFTVDLFKVFEDAKRKVGEVGDSFHNLWDRVVGHSYIPDLVEGVGSWMSRLQQAMVDPATKATQDTGDRFQALRDRVRGLIEGLLTDKERLDLAFAGEQADLNNPDTVANTDPRLLAEMRRRAAQRNARDNAGLDAEGLTQQDVVDPGPLEDIKGLKAIQDAWASIQQKIHDSREKFAESFEYGIRAALDGDWKSVLSIIFGDTMSSALKGLGKSLFDKFGGSGGGGFSFASLFSKLPGFANGGTILPGGAGGIDSQLTAFWKSPSEQVDIYEPGADRGGAMALSVEASPYFDVRVRDVAQPLAVQAASASAAFSAKTIPAQMSRRGRQQFRGGVG